MTDAEVIAYLFGQRLAQHTEPDNAEVLTAGYWDSFGMTQTEAASADRLGDARFLHFVSQGYWAWRHEHYVT